MSENKKREGADLGAAPSSEESTENRTSSYASSNNFDRKNHSDLEQECLAAMAGNGLPFDGPIVADGGIKRYSCDQKKNEDEWYVAFAGSSEKGNHHFNCVFGTWSGGGEKFQFSSWDKDWEISSEEREDIKKLWEGQKKQAENERAREEGRRANRVQDAWNTASDEPNGAQAYLDRKKIGAHSIRFGSFGFDEGTEEIPKWVHHDTVIIPLRDINGALRSVQHIRADGEKRIYGPKRGNFHLVGEIGQVSKILVAEGYATGISVHEQTGDPVVIAVDCGNLDPVICALREKYSSNPILILGDDDVETKDSRERPCNPGRIKAEAAAKKYDCRVAFPKFPEGDLLPNGKRPTDWNDLHVHFGGIEEVKRQLPKKNRLNPVDIADLLTRKLLPKKEILSPWLREKDLAMIYSPRGLGKTWFALNIAYAISSGGEFLKYRAQEPRKVLYVDGEMAAVSMQERMAKISQSHKKEPPDPSFFRLITHDLEEYPIRDLADNLGQEDINAHMDSFDVLILDNLSCLVRSGDENEAASWVIIQEWLQSLRKVGKTAIIIHHAGKNGKQRGTSKKEDILDTVIALKKVRDGSPSDGARFEVHYEKNRGFDGEAAKPFEANLVSGREGVAQWVFKDVEGRNREDALALLKEGMNVTDVAKEMNVNKSTVSRWKKNANL